MASQVAQSGKESAYQCRRCKFNPWVGKIGEDTLEKEMATHSSVLAWEIPWTEQLVSMYWIDTVHRVAESDMTEHTHTELYLKFFLNLSRYCFCFMFGFFGSEARGVLVP